MGGDLCYDRNCIGYDIMTEHTRVSDHRAHPDKRSMNQ